MSFRRLSNKYSSSSHLQDDEILREEIFSWAGRGEVRIDSDTKIGTNPTGPVFEKDVSVTFLF